MNTRGALWSPIRMLVFLVRRVIVDPVREGRLRNNGWPAGLSAIVTVGITAYVLLMLVAVFAPQLRAQFDLTKIPPNLTVPLAVTPVLLVLLVFSLALMYTAALHMVWWIRVPLVVLTMGAVLTAGGMGEDLTAARWVAIGAAVVLACFTLMRWFARFHWGEFVVALAVIGHGTVVPVWLQSQLAVPSTQPFVTWSAVLQVYVVLFHLAIPVAMLAGAAMAELTASTVAWSVTTVWQGLRVWRRSTWVFAAIGLVACYGVFIWSLVSVLLEGDYRGDPAALAAGALYAAVPMGVCSIVTWRADQVPTGDRPVRPDPDDIPEAWAETAPILALVLGLGSVGWGLVTLVARSFGLSPPGLPDSPWSLRIIAFLSSFLIVVWAWRLAGRGRRILPMGLVSFAAVLVVDNILGAFMITWSYTGMLVMVLAMAVVVGLWLVATSRMTADRGMALATVCLLGAAFEFREVIFEPLTALIGLFGVGSALLVGLIWRVLTDNNYSRGDSRRFPRSGRVLIAVASALFAAIAAAMDTIMGGDWIGDLNPFEGSGDRYLGVSLIIVVLFAGLSLAARGRVVRGHEHQVEGVEFEGNIYPAPPAPAEPASLPGD